jgi:hypothetical protein
MRQIERIASSIEPTDEELQRGTDFVDGLTLLRGALGDLLEDSNRVQDEKFNFNGAIGQHALIIPNSPIPRLLFAQEAGEASRLVLKGHVTRPFVAATLNTFLMKGEDLPPILRDKGLPTKATSYGWAEVLKESTEPSAVQYLYQLDLGAHTLALINRPGKLSMNFTPNTNLQRAREEARQGLDRTLIANGIESKELRDALIDGFARAASGRTANKQKPSEPNRPAN